MKKAKICVVLMVVCVLAFGALLLGPNARGIDLATSTISISVSLNYDVEADRLALEDEVGAALGVWRAGILNSPIVKSVIMDNNPPLSGGPAASMIIISVTLNYGVEADRLALENSIENALAGWREDVLKNPIVRMLSVKTNPPPAGAPAWHGLWWHWEVCSWEII